jgi:hypothetical protein
MTAISITPGYPTFADTDGSPLNDGYVYIGLEYQDPITAPTTAFWDKDFRIPADQPLRTSGGYVVRDGSPAAVYTGAAYSILVQNKNLVTVYNAPSAVITNVTNDVEIITQYQGAHATDPVARNDGTPLQTGDLYFNTVVNELKVWTGTVWVPAVPGTVTVENFTGTGAQTAFNLATAPVAENNTQIYIDGVYQQKDTYTLSGATINFSTAPPLNSTIEVVTFSISSLGTTDASNVSYNEGSAGAVNTSVQAKLQETVSVKDFGAAGDGVTDDTAAFNNCRTATSGRYLIPSGSYVLDASPNVWEDTFTAPNGSTQLIIGGTTYDISGSFGSGWSTRIPATQRYLYWLHARTGKTIAIWSDGELSGDSNRFFLPFDVRRDSHFFIAAPETNNGSTDLLFRRSEANPDPTGNRFAINFEEASDRYNLTYATTASGSPSFDSAYQVIAGLTPSLIFPALSLDMKQGYTIQTRAGGALRIQNYPDSDTTQVIRDATSGNVLQKINKSRQAIAGVGFDTLLDTPQGVTQPRMWGGVFSDTGSEVDGTLPVTKNIWDTVGATNNQVIGTLMVAAATSGGNLYYRESRFVFDGTTVTITDLVNTLPVQIVSTIALSGTSLQFQASYAGGLGTGCTVTAMINWCGAGR